MAKKSVKDPKFELWNERRERGEFWSGKPHSPNAYPAVSALLDYYDPDWDWNDRPESEGDEEESWLAERVARKS